jgi:hypothetical protein
MLDETDLCPNLEIHLGHGSKKPLGQRGLTEGLALRKARPCEEHDQSTSKSSIGPSTSRHSPAELEARRSPARGAARFSRHGEYAVGPIDREE